MRLNAPVHVGDASEHSVNWSAPVFFAAAKKRPFRPRLLDRAQVAMIVLSAMMIDLGPAGFFKKSRIHWIAGMD